MLLDGVLELRRLLERVRLWSERIRTLGPKVGQSAFGRTVSGLLAQKSEFTPLQLGTNLDSQVEVTQIVNPSRIAISKKGDKQRTVGDKQRTPKLVS